MKVLTKTEWDNLFRNILTVAQKCGYLTHPSFKDAQEQRVFLLNAYRESMYITKAYPVCGMANDLLAAFVAYAGMADKHNLDFKEFLVQLYRLFKPYFEKAEMSDDEWSTLVRGIGELDEKFSHNFLVIISTMMGVFENQYKEGGAYYA